MLARISILWDAVVGAAIPTIAMLDGPVVLVRKTPDLAAWADHAARARVGLPMQRRAP